MENIKKAYSEILKVLNKYKDVCVYDIEDLEYKAKLHIYGVELKEKYGFDINPKDIDSLNHNNLSEHLSISSFGSKYNRTISYSDNKKQPEDELLLKIGFPTGAYIFGEDYPVDLFNELFLELKSYNPKYTDSLNKSLYFSMDNAGKIFNEFKYIISKYYEINKEDLKKRKIKKIKEELEKLESSTNIK